MTTKIDPLLIPAAIGSTYPAPFDRPCAQRQRRRLGDAAALTQFGVNLTTLPTGTWSSQRHWHAQEDEFIYVIEGEVVLVSNSGEQVLRPGECAGFKAGVADGHHLQNRSGRDALILEVGARRREVEAVTYPDIDLKVEPGAATYSHVDGKPYACR